MTAREKAKTIHEGLRKKWKCWYPPDSKESFYTIEDQCLDLIERALLDTIEEFRTECMCLHAKLMGRLDLKGDQQFLSGEISALNKYAAEIRKMGEK